MGGSFVFLGSGAWVPRDSLHGSLAVTLAVTAVKSSACWTSFFLVLRVRTTTVFVHRLCGRQENCLSLWTRSSLHATQRKVRRLVF